MGTSQKGKDASQYIYMYMHDIRQRLSQMYATKYCLQISSATPTNLYAGHCYPCCSSVMRVRGCRFQYLLCPLLPLRWLAKSFWPALHSAFGPQGGDGLKFLHLLIKLHGCDRRAKPAGGAPSILLTCEYN